VVDVFDTGSAESVMTWVFITNPWSESNKFDVGGGMLKAILKGDKIFCPVHG